MLEPYQPVIIEVATDKFTLTLSTTTDFFILKFDE